MFNATNLRSDTKSRKTWLDSRYAGYNDPDSPDGRDLIGELNTFTAQQHAAVKANLSRRTHRRDTHNYLRLAAAREANDDFDQATMDIVLNGTHGLTRQLRADLSDASAQRNALRAYHLRTKAEIATLSLEIAEHEERIEKLHQKKFDLPEKFMKDRERLAYQSGDYLHGELDKVRKKNRDEFGVDENGNPVSDPQDEVLRQEAWEANRDALHEQYAKKGLGAEFEILERHRNGESVDPEELAKAQEKVRSKKFSADLDVAMYRNDRNNAFFKTEKGLMVRLANNQEILIVADLRMKKTEDNLRSEIQRLEELKEKKSNLKVSEKDTAERISRIDDLIEKKKAQLKRAGILETRLQDPDFKKAFKDGKVDQRDLVDFHKEYNALQSEVDATDKAYHANNPGIHDRNISGPDRFHTTRTSRSAAGPIGAMAEQDGISKDAFGGSSSKPLADGTPHQESQPITLLRPDSSRKAPALAVPTAA